MEILPAGHRRDIRDSGDGRRHGRNGKGTGATGRAVHGHGRKHLPALRSGGRGGSGSRSRGRTRSGGRRADYSDIEPEEDEEETDYEPTPEEIRELEEDEELGAYYPDGNPDFATGYSFDDLEKVHRVLVSDNADEKAEREAREVLPSVMGSDIWEAMLDEFEGARERVARLMDNHNV